MPNPWRDGFEATRDWQTKLGFNSVSKQEYSAGYQKAIVHSSENFNHFMTKAGIVFVLTKRNRPVSSELRMKVNGPRGTEITKKKYDVFDAKNLSIIGVEDTSPEKDADFVVKVNALPLEIKKALRELEMIIKEMIP